MRIALERNTIDLLALWTFYRIKEVWSIFTYSDMYAICALEYFPVRLFIRAKSKSPGS